MSGRLDLADSDLRRVHDEGAERDVKLRTELSAMSAEIAIEAQKVADGHSQLASSVATIAVKMGELHGVSGGAARHRQA